MAEEGACGPRRLVLTQRSRVHVQHFGHFHLASVPALIKAVNRWYRN